MLTSTRGSRHERGQIIVIFAAAITTLTLLVGLVIDGGYALAQRRSAQNTSDMAALAGARVLAAFVTGDRANGTDANVRLSIDRVIAANGGQPITYGQAGSPQYVATNGAPLGAVGSGSIPAGAVGVIVPSSRKWNPFFLGIVGVSDWTASATATARGGYRAGGPPVGNLLPIGVSKATYDTGAICPAGTPTSQCTTTSLTEGSLNIPGGFGWLKFGCQGPDSGGNPYGLGQVPPASNGGCQENTPFLVGQWGDPTATPPQPPQTYGCCTAIGQPGSGDDIGSLPGNKASLTDTTPGVAYYEMNAVIGFVPIWDYAALNGSNAYYHIIGYAGFQIVHVSGATNIIGILRQVIFNGPVTDTSPGFAGAPLAIRLIK